MSRPAHAPLLGCPSQAQIQTLTRRRADLAGPDPEALRMLPSVHLAWAPLMGALQVQAGSVRAVCRARRSRGSVV